MCFTVFLSSNFIPRVRHTLKSPCVAADWKFVFFSQHWKVLNTSSCAKAFVEILQTENFSRPVHGTQ